MMISTSPIICYICYQDKRNVPERAQHEGPDFFMKDDGHLSCTHSSWLVGKHAFRSKSDYLTA